MTAFALQYDSGANTVGNLTNVYEYSGKGVTYQYDELYRLKSEAHDKAKASER